MSPVEYQIAYQRLFHSLLETLCLSNEWTNFPRQDLTLLKFSYHKMTFKVKHIKIKQNT